MKVLSTSILGLLLLICTTPTLLAQSQLTDEQKAEIKAQVTAEVEDYFAALDLTEEQKTEFENITRKYAEKMKTVAESDSGRRKKMKELKGLSNAKNEEMKALLNDDQFAVYEDKREEMKARRKELRKRKQ